MQKNNHDAEIKNKIKYEVKMCKLDMNIKINLQTYRCVFL